MFAAAFVFLVIGLLIHNGKTELIHNYHQTMVKGKAFSKSMLVITFILMISGAIALFGESMYSIVASMGALVIGIVISFIFILKVQNKYNNGVF